MRCFSATEVTKANVTMELPPLTPIVQTTKAPPLQDKLPLDRKLSIQIGQGKQSCRNFKITIGHSV